MCVCRVEKMQWKANSRTLAGMAGFARHRPNPLLCEKLVGLENGREDYGLFQEDY
jgi:hypothetical protein